MIYVGITTSDEFFFVHNCIMAYKRALEALNRTLKDLRNNTTLIENLTVVLPSDFRKTLSIILKGTRADEV